MQNFQYYAPTQVVFGRDTENQVAELVKNMVEAQFLFITVDRALSNPDLSRYGRGLITRRETAYRHQALI